MNVPQVYYFCTLEDKKLTWTTCQARKSLPVPVTDLLA